MGVYEFFGILLDVDFDLVGGRGRVSFFNKFLGFFGVVGFWIIYWDVSIIDVGRNKRVKEIVVVER